MNPRKKIQLPSCGVFIGNAIYNTCAGYLCGSGPAYTTWASDNTSPLELIDLTVEENQGNLVQFWWYDGGSSPTSKARYYALEDIDVEISAPDWKTGQNITLDSIPVLERYRDRAGAGVLKALRYAAEKGLYSQLLYCDSNECYSKQFSTLGDSYLGYDFGERFTFDRVSLIATENEEPTLDVLAEAFCEKVRAYVGERRMTGWGMISCTGANFGLDYELAAGIDFTVYEDCCMELNFISSLSRGLHKQYNTPLWGAHIANEHYTWLPFGNPHRFETLRSQLYLKYMAGAKLLISESGAWHVQTTSDDSPMTDTPRVNIPVGQFDQSYAVKLHEDVIRHYSSLDRNSSYCKSFRKVISDFYTDVKQHGTPSEQPAVSLAAIKGNYDLSTLLFSGAHRRNAVAGMSLLAERYPNWYESDPEYSWNILQKVFFPRPSGIFGEDHYNRLYSGTPYGQIDVISFAFEAPPAEYLLKNYKVLLFTGWNTCTEQQYETLCEYVRRGGILFAAIPHFATLTNRNFRTYTAENLIRGGDLSELCGVRVKEPGQYFYWCTGVSKEKNCLGIDISRRYGPYYSRYGAIERTDASAEVILFEHESLTPLLLHRKLGKGEVFFLNTWSYPGAFDYDHGPKAPENSAGFVEDIFRYLACRTRGDVFLSGVSSEEPDSECFYLSWSYFPESHEFFVFNVDFEHSHQCCVHRFGSLEILNLKPGEFLRRKWSAF